MAKHREKLWEVFNKDTKAKDCYNGKHRIKNLVYGIQEDACECYKIGNPLHFITLFGIADPDHPLICEKYEEKENG